MFKIIFGGCVLLALIASQASAATVHLTFTNRSGEVVNSVSSLPKGQIDAASLILTSGPIAPGEAMDVAIEMADDICVYDLTINFGSGTSSTMPDTDICQTDGIIIE